MTNFRINFEHPWLLLLLIPAIALPLISYFRLGKRYRFTRNRITSIALHITVMVLSIMVLVGLSFSYYLPNTTNEVILLVDASYSADEEHGDDVDDFIKTVIDSTDSKFKLGIVTFGYDQVYAAELSNDTRSTYSDYSQAPTPDTTATDVASALTYAASLFDKPESARIVLLSDALETDNSAKNVIKAVAAEGIKVDTVYLPGKTYTNEVQLIGMESVEERILVGQPFNIELLIESSYEGAVAITAYDNTVPGEPFEAALVKGTNKITVPFNFPLPGLHELEFQIATDKDTIGFNNVYKSFMYLEIFDDILIIEAFEGESEALTAMLKEELNVTIVAANDAVNMPDTLKELRQYDEVILCNVANRDLPVGFEEILYQYVYEVGGGLFTVCGNKPGEDPRDNPESVNAYTREDMYGSLYQEMLPVEVVNYTPPVAVMLLIDISKSMYTPGAQGYEGSILQGAINGARACLNVLSERDYVGIMTLAETYEERLELTPRTKTPEILAAIDEIEAGAIEGTLGKGNNTFFATALERAGIALSSTSVEKRHIIVVTDGQPTEEEERYTKIMTQNANLGITMSIVGVGCNDVTTKKMQGILKEYAKVSEDNFHQVADVESVPETMRGDLSVPEIKDVNYDPFYPTVKDSSSIVMNDLFETELPLLDGFYGVKLKEGASVILSSEYTPIYAEWTFGEGRVGTFACDLNGTWSSDLINSSAGSTLINNIITSLFPSKSVKAPDIDTEITGDNYATNLSVFTDLLEGEYIEVTIESPSADGMSEPTVQTIVAGASDGYSRIPFSVKTSGIHKITVQKKNASGEVLAETIAYKALSYSKEYDAFADNAAAKELAAQLAKDSEGEQITDPYQVFQNAIKYIHKVIDPKLPFMIAAVVLFLLDIAVRKFKWKWPHEIIRDRKITRSMSGK